MKLFKYSVLALALAAGFSSCSDEDDYVPGAASTGVYFPTDDALEVTLDRNAAEFDVIVSRMGESAAATYSLTGTSSDNEAFTFPTSVSFAEGESTTKVHVGYNKDLLALDKPYTVILSFAEGTLLSNYGYASLEMSVTLPAPWTTIGTGTFKDMFILPFYGIHSDADPELTNEWECELQQHDIDPTRYRWLHPYGENFAKYCSAMGIAEFDSDKYDSKGQYNIEFVTDAQGHAVVPYQWSGVTLGSDGMVKIGTEGGMYYSNGNSLAAIVSAKPETVSVFDATPGKQTLMLLKGQVIGGFSNDSPDENIYMPNYNPGGYVWWANGVEMTDYEIGLKYLGVLNTPDEESYVIADVTLGEDLASVKAALVATNDQTAAIEAVQNGTVEAIELNKSVSAQRFAYDGSGDYVLAAVGYNESGEEAATAAISFFVVDSSAPKEWKKLGTGMMAEAWILPAFSRGGVRVDPLQEGYSIAMEENIENPGIYRMIAPWTCADYPVASMNENTNPDLKPNVVIDARNAAFVTMAPQYSGWDMQGYNFWVSTLADAFVTQGYSQAQITQAGYNNIFEDGTIQITFPTWSNLNTTTEAPEVCGKSFYGDDEPYSEELEVCPALFILPNASQQSVAKAMMNHTAARIEASYRNNLESYARKFNMGRVSLREMQRDCTPYKF